jgi:hypothetical protein
MCSLSSDHACGLEEVSLARFMTVGDCCSIDNMAEAFLGKHGEIGGLVAQYLRSLWERRQVLHAHRCYQAGVLPTETAVPKSMET